MFMSKFNMKLDFYPLKLYFSTLSIAIFSGLALLINLFNWVWLWIQIPSGEEYLFLHYNILFGVDKIGNSWKIFYIPLLGLFILIVNVFLGWILFKKDKFMAQLLNFVALLCQLFIVIAVFLIVFLNV